MPHRLGLERGPQPEGVEDVVGVEDRHLDAAVGLAAQHALGDQDLGRGAEGVAGDPEALGELGLAQAAAGLELAVEDQLAEHVGGRVDGRDGVQMQVRGCLGWQSSFHLSHYSTIRQNDGTCCGFRTAIGFRRRDSQIRGTQRRCVTGGLPASAAPSPASSCAEGARVLVADRDRDGLAAPRERLGQRAARDDRGRPRRARRPGRARRGRPRSDSGGVDVLVNNAGLMRQTPALEISDRRVGRAVRGQPAGDLLPHPGRRRARWPSAGEAPSSRSPR